MKKFLLLFLIPLCACKYSPTITTSKRENIIIDTFMIKGSNYMIITHSLSTPVVINLTKDSLEVEFYKKIFKDENSKE